MAKRVSYWLGLAAALALVCAPAAFAHEEKALTKEQRAKMADVHQKMAECLRSERPISECRAEMMKGCKDTMGAEGCPMMGHGPGMMEKGHGKGGGMMQGPPPQPAPPEKK